MYSSAVAGSVSGEWEPLRAWLAEVQPVTQQTDIAKTNRPLLLIDTTVTPVAVRLCALGGSFRLRQVQSTTDLKFTHSWDCRLRTPLRPPATARPTRRAEGGHDLHKHGMEYENYENIRHRTL